MTEHAKHTSGYAALARFIASDHDKSTAVYRRFDRLAARNLLYLQGQLNNLEQRLDELDAQDLQGGSTADVEATRDLALLQRRATAGDAGARERLGLLDEISVKLAAYKEALVLESKLLAFEPPSKRVLQALRNTYNNVDSSPSGPPFPALDEPPGRPQMYEHVDLVSLRKSRQDDDRMTVFLRTHLPMLFVKERTGGHHALLVHMAEARLRAVVSVVNIVAAAAFLFGAVYNLYYVSSNEVKLGLIALYTVAFASCVGLLTNAQRAEVFGACAAYAAVLVVFVSGGLTDERTGSRNYRGSSGY